MLYSIYIVYRGVCGNYGNVLQREAAEGRSVLSGALTISSGGYLLTSLKALKTLFNSIYTYVPMFMHVCLYL